MVYEPRHVRVHYVVHVLKEEPDESLETSPRRRSNYINGDEKNMRNTKKTHFTYSTRSLLLAS